VKAKQLDEGIAHISFWHWSMDGRLRNACPHRGLADTFVQLRRSIGFGLMLAVGAAVA